jgi:integrase/recombinase XerD
MFTVKRKELESWGVELVDAEEQPIPVVSLFLKYIAARGCSPNTVLAYAYDLAHLWSFLAVAQLGWEHLSAEQALDFLVHLRVLPSKRRGSSRCITLVADRGSQTSRGLSASTINRMLAAVSSFYDWAILSDRFQGSNPLAKVEHRNILRVSDRHRPFLDGISRRTPMARLLRVKTVRRLPRPMSNEQTDALLGTVRNLRDGALLRLMLNAGLRPGEALGLHLADIAYGRRRIAVRWRDDHPRGVRSKSRTERLVDLHDSATLAALSAYVMTERPVEAETSIVFLVGGNGSRRNEPLSYAALVRLFARACKRVGIRESWMTPHALRHTHATQMWEAGMRELTLQRRLGHASLESTRIYTRVSDAAVVAEYRQALGLSADVPLAKQW